MLLCRMQPAAAGAPGYPSRGGGAVRNAAGAWAGSATFSTEVKVVNVLATVRNKGGTLVGTLGQDDFALSEDGRPQTIKYFARDTHLPLTLGLMVDTSGSQRRVLDAERGACLRFLDQVVRPNKDKVFLMQFDSAVQMRQSLTNLVANWTTRWRMWIPKR